MRLIQDCKMLSRRTSFLLQDPVQSIHPITCKLLSALRFYLLQQIHTVDYTINIHDSIKSRFIKFIVLAGYKILPPLDGAAHLFRKTRQISQFSFTAPVKDISHFIFLLFTLILLSVQKNCFHKIFNFFYFYIVYKTWYVLCF